MSWARLDDRIAFHPKVIAAGDAAFGLWVRLLTHSCAHQTDGFVPASTLRMFGANRSVYEVLVKVGLLDRARGGFQVHDFLDWNPSGEQAKAKQAEVVEKRRAAGRVGGRKSAEARKSAEKRHTGQANGQANGKQTAKQSATPFACPDGEAKSNPRPVPSRPEETPLSPPTGGASPTAGPESETKAGWRPLTARPWYAEEPK